MPVPTPLHVPASGIDAFLQVQTKRAGRIKGESNTAGHIDDIEVVGWHWGLSANSALGSTAATGRRAYTALTIIKRIDAATTPLLAALATNDEVKQAKLALRRSGGSQDDYFTITLTNARVSSLNHNGDANGQTQETLTLAFTKVEVSYTRQQASGMPGATSMFMDELPNN